jgi:uncharacterized protein (DUF486 family)
MPPALATVAMLIASNAFMTWAWYGHLQDGRRDSALWIAIGSSWLIALPEYCLAVPANRIGAGAFSLNQLKILQEGIAIAVFLVVSLVAWKQVPRWQDLLAYALILGGLAVALLSRAPRA